MTRRVMMMVMKRRRWKRFGNAEGKRHGKRLQRKGENSGLEEISDDDVLREKVMMAMKS